MSENVQTAMFEILNAIRSELADHRDRYDTIEGLVRKQRRDAAGLLVMAKSVVGDFAEQLAAIEERVAALEGRKV
jgi:hypothetical protein